MKGAFHQSMAWLHAWACMALGATTVMPTSRDDAVLTGLLASFLVYAAVILWVFATSSLSRIWWGLGSMTATFAGLSVMLSVAVP